MTTFERLKKVFSPSLTDNANVNVFPLNSSWLALTETCNMVRFSPDSLETLGIARFEDKVSAQITTAHPLIDQKSHEVYNLCISIGPHNHYLLTSTDWHTLARKVLVKIPVRQTGYIHSFAQTERYLILVEPPMLLNSAELILGTKPYIDCYTWHVGRGTRLIVVEKASGNYYTCDFEDRFFFHQINAFETKDRICLDLASYADAEVIDSFRLRNLIDTGGPIPSACYERIEIDIANKRVITRDRAECFFELPTINRQFDCSKYRFVYGAGSSSNNSFFNQLVKLDTTDESVKRFSQKGCYYGEPVFVPRTEAGAEDDGIVLSIELNAISRQSSLLFVDAKSMHEVGRALLPHMVPFGFHGQFIRTGNT